MTAIYTEEHPLSFLPQRWFGPVVFPPAVFGGVPLSGGRVELGGGCLLNSFRPPFLLAKARGLSLLTPLLVSGLLAVRSGGETGSPQLFLSAVHRDLPGPLNHRIMLIRAGCLSVH